jgi:hypothetical protein
MTKRTHRFVPLLPLLLVPVVVHVVACTSNGRSNADARLGMDAASCAYGSTTYAPGATFRVGCQNCSCLPTGVVECTPGLCLVDSGTAELAGQDTSPGDGCGTSAEACLYSGGLLAVGQSGVDGCSSYTCEGGGKLTCTAVGCATVDASAPADCELPTTLAFGSYGGLDAGSRITLDTSGTVTVTSSARSCSAKLPACGTGCAVTVATIAKDLADPDVQAAFARGPATVFGVSLISRDIADFLVTLGDGQSLQVGGACCRFPDLPCQPIPLGVQRLVNDLQNLMAAITGCP